MEKPSTFFSIIIPVFNAAGFLDDTIKSVINQTLIDWELIIVDDGSKDRSLTLAKNWAEKDKRIKVLQHFNAANKGVSASRNHGINQAKGEWIAFLDADDLWFPDKLQKQADVIKKYKEHNLIFVYSTAKIIDEHGNYIDNQTDKKAYNPKISSYGAGVQGLHENEFEKIINKGFEAPTSSVVCLKSVIEHLGGFEEDMRFSEDGLMWYRIIENGSFYFIDQTLMKYRVHSTQWNASVTEKLKLTRRFIAYERLQQYVSETHNKKVSYLLVNKGFRIIARNNIGIPYFNLKNIFYYWIRLLKNGKVYTIHKLYSFFVVIFEILILPYRLLRHLIRT